MLPWLENTEYLQAPGNGAKLCPQDMNSRGFTGSSSGGEITGRHFNPEELWS